MAAVDRSLVSVLEMRQEVPFVELVTQLLEMELLMRVQ
jgi:hypothetical protein